MYANIVSEEVFFIILCSITLGNCVYMKMEVNITIRGLVKGITKTFLYH